MSEVKEVHVTPSLQLEIVTVASSPSLELERLKEALDKQKLNKDWFKWWILTDTPKAFWDEDWIGFAQFSSDFVTQLKGSLLCLLSVEVVPDIEFLAVLHGFMRFNRDKFACYVPARNGAGVKPVSPKIFGKSPVLDVHKSSCIVLRAHAEYCWEDEIMLDQVVAQTYLWPASSTPKLTLR